MHCPSNLLIFKEHETVQLVEKAALSPSFVLVLFQMFYKVTMWKSAACLHVVPFVFITHGACQARIYERFRPLFPQLVLPLFSPLGTQRHIRETFSTAHSLVIEAVRVLSRVAFAGRPGPSSARAAPSRGHVCVSVRSAVLSGSGPTPLPSPRDASSSRPGACSLCVKATGGPGTWR